MGNSRPSLDNGSRFMNNFRMSKTITTVGELIEAFGGTAKMAEMLDVGMSTISNWKAQSDIPPGWHLRLFLEAQRRGFSIHPSVFGLPQDLRPRHKGRRPFRVSEFASAK